MAAFQGPGQRLPPGPCPSALRQQMESRCLERSPRPRHSRGAASAGKVSRRYAPRNDGTRLRKKVTDTLLERVSVISCTGGAIDEVQQITGGTAFSAL